MIRLENIHIGYEHKPLAIQQTEICLKPGRFIALLGANGCGKSTLLRAITTGAHLLSGDSFYHETPIHKLGNQQRATIIAVVLTSRELNGLLTVQELFALSRAPHTAYMGTLNPIDLEIIEETSTIFNCNNLLDKRLNQLSDGQLQRVLVARALVQDTPYIFMDEPSSHLDINYKASLLATLKSYCNKKQKCIVFASHELEIATELSDDILSIHHGTIALETAKEFLENKKLSSMFPSEHVSFIGGKAVYKF